MSSRAIIVPFFRPSWALYTYKCLEDFFIRHLNLWANEIDHLYIIDSNWQTNIKFPNLHITVHTTYQNSHWANLNQYLPTITEDYFAIIDNDTFFYRQGIVDSIFSKLDNYDIVSMTDTSGGLNLHKKYHFLDENQNRSIRQRFTPYLFACRREFFNKIGQYDFTPLSGNIWTDSMGVITDQLLSLNPSIYEIPDDRTTLYFREDGNHQAAAFLDSNHHKWSQVCPKDYGYYHIRNFGGGISFLEKRNRDKASYRRELSITPIQEALRMLAWVWLVSCGKFKTEILSVVNDFKVSSDMFLDYIKSFLLLHKYLEQFQ
jgi:hypothetical protein